eukprot:4830333-Prymnesium_polylepis.1
MAKHARRLALLEAGGEPLGTGSLCVDCGTPRTVFNTGVCCGATPRKDAAHIPLRRVRPVPLGARV